MALKILKYIVWLFLVPEIAGLGWLSFKKDNKNMIFALLIGYMTEFAVFQLLAIPMIFRHEAFTTLAYTWALTMLGLCIIFTIKISKRFEEIVVDNLKELRKMPIFLTIAMIVIVGCQAYVAFNYMYEDDDDTNFVAKATIARDTNTLYEYSDTGSEISEIPWRTGLSPYPIYTATISVLLDTHPAIVAHTVFPTLFIPVAYLLYYLMGKSFFKGDKSKAVVFVIILSVLGIFGNYSRYTVFARLLTRLWQGKSMLCAIIIPFAWYLFMEYIGKEKDGFYWFILFITMWGADMLSSMALFLVPLATGFIVLMYLIKYRKIRYIPYYALCLVPTLIYGLISLQLK